MKKPPGSQDDEAAEFPDLEALEAAEEAPLHAFLSNDDVLAAKAKARTKLEAERRTKAMKRIEEEEMERLRLEEGLTTGDQVKDELISITMDLAQHSDKVTINGRPYWHGFTYDVPRHVADTLRESMSRGWQHQDEIDGKNRAQQYQTNRQFSLLQKGKAAPAQNTVSVGAGGAVSGVKPANLGLRAGPEDHAHG